MDPLSEDLEYFLDTFGLPKTSLAIDAEVEQFLASRVPSGYIDFIKKVGVGVWLDGYFQLCNPLQMKPIIDKLLKGDPDLNPAESTAIAFSGVGDLIIWNTNHREVNVSFSRLQVSCNFLFEPNEEISELISFGTMLNYLNAVSFGGFDDNGTPLFPGLLKRHRPLEIGEIFAPQLPPALGGTQDIQNYRPVQALEAFGLMLSAGPFTLTDLRPFPPLASRLIGHQ